MQQAKREGKKEAEETEERQRRLGSAKEVEKGVEEEEEQRRGQDWIQVIFLQDPFFSPQNSCIT